MPAGNAGAPESASMPLGETSDPVDRPWDGSTTPSSPRILRPAVQPEAVGQRPPVAAVLAAGLSVAGRVACAPVTSLGLTLPIAQTQNAASQPIQRAYASWGAINASMRKSDGMLENSSVEDHVAYVWGYSQAMAGALDLARVTGDYREFTVLARNLENYRSPKGGYAPDTSHHQGIGDRYYDDNAWLGLNFIQAYSQTGNREYLQKAREVFDFLKTGMVPGGGLLWKENAERPTYNTCAIGPAIELALRLHMATSPNPHDTNTEYFQTAQRLDNLMETHLRISEGPLKGLYADNIGVDFTRRSNDIWSYNQGTPIGADVLFYRVTGDAAYLHRAQETATASMRYFGAEDRLWGHPPAFNAIWLRNLLQLEAQDPNPAFRDVLSTYLERAWNDARNPKNGLFAADPRTRFGGCGPRDGRTELIDQSAMVQLYALQSTPVGSNADVA